jgi:hypothetical protein
LRGRAGVAVDSKLTVRLFWIETGTAVANDRPHLAIKTASLS